MPTEYGSSLSLNRASVIFNRGSLIASWTNLLPIFFYRNREAIKLEYSGSSGIITLMNGQ